MVRLKGGCPSVFARVGSELRTLAAAGVPVELVPGVSSALAAPLLAGELSSALLSELYGDKSQTTGADAVEAGGNEPAKCPKTTTALVLGLRCASMIMRLLDTLCNRSVVGLPHSQLADAT